MGTSKSFSTPSGGKWSDLKKDVTGFLGGNSDITPAQIVSGTVAAAGGLAVPLVSRPPGSGGAGGGGGGAGSARRVLTGAASALGSFGATVRGEGLGQALARLGLAELRDRPAVEVVARVAEHLAADAEGLAADVLTAAFREALLEAARLEGDTSYEALETSLQAFLEREGVEGLVALFLERYVFERVWVLIESHAQLRSDSDARSNGLLAGVEGACSATVRGLIEDFQTDGRLEQVDWFGGEGRRLADALVLDLERRLGEVT